MRSDKSVPRRPQFSLEPIEQKTTTELVAESLLAELSKGTLKPGDRLSPERELAKQLRVGRTTVREALKLLTLSGLLEAKPGQGTYVRQEFTSFLSQQIEWPLLLDIGEVEMIVEVREALETKSVRLAAERRTPEDIERLRVFQQVLEIRGRDIEQETALDLAFHHAIAAASQNKLLSRLMRALDNMLRHYMALSGHIADTVEETMAEHQVIYEAIAAGDPDAAEQAMVDHLVCSKSSILRMLGR